MIGTVLRSVAAVVGWTVAFGFASLFVVAALSASTGNEVLTWFVAWEMSDGIRGGMSTGAMLQRMVWNSMVSAGFWQFLVVVPIWRVSRMVFGETTRQWFTTAALALGVIALLNPRGLLRGDELPYLLNLDVLTWFPAVVLVGRALDAQFSGRGARRAALSAPTRGR